MKRIIAFAILIFILASVFYVVIKDKQPKDMVAAKRSFEEYDPSVVYIDDEAIALAGNPSTDPEMRELAVAAYEKTNEHRTAQGLTTLVWSERLVTDAFVRSQEIETKFSHTRPNGNDWWTVDSEHMFGENLAQGYGESDAVVNAWINSPSHRANLEDGEFATCGIAAWRGSDGNVYIAQEFGY